MLSPVENIDGNTGMDRLSNIATISRKLLQRVGRDSHMKEFSSTENIEETVKMLQYVMKNKKWDEPYLEVNLLLEWALFRSFASLGTEIPHEFGPILNSEGTEPIFTAGGNRPDLVAEFDSFVLVIESTVTSGARQYNTETEPVARHIAEIQKSYNEKKVFSLFIAREIDQNVLEYFLIYHAFHKHPTSNKYLLIVPITIENFIKVYRKLTSPGSVSEKILLQMFEQIEKSRSEEQCEKCNISDLNIEKFSMLVETALKKII